MALQTGQILDGKYRIIRELGSGAMGAVYEGENIRIRRRVAIKVLLPAIARNRDAVQRFEREAQAAARIGSDHIVEVLDLGTMPDGGFYMVMEYLEGQTLKQRIRASGRLGPKVVAPMVQQVLFGLEMAHQAKIIHRDLKPDNVFLMREHTGQKDFVKILDFGVSKFNPLSADDEMSMTRTGAVVGTPFYMAPEQAKGARDIDHRSDLYSVGVILYEAITGQVPFHAGTFNELIFKIVLEQPAAPETFVPDLDPSFSRIVRRAMAREPNDRYQNAGEFRDALSMWLHTGSDGLGTVLMEPPPAGSAPEWTGSATRVIDDELDDDTQVNASSGKGRSQRPPPSRPAPPSRSAPPRRAAPAGTQPMPAMPAPPPPMHPGDLHAAPMQPMQPMQAMQPAFVGPTVPSPQAFALPPTPHLGPGMPTPIGMRAPVFPMDEPVAGLPSRRAPLFALLGVVAALALGGVIAIFVLRSGSADATASPPAATKDEPAPQAEPTPEPADTEEVASAPPSDTAAGDEEEPGTSEANAKVEPPPRTNGRPPPPKPSTESPPPSKDKPPDGSKPKEKTKTKDGKGKSGRNIKTEL
jgi:serine/threonine-protein kinase